MRETGTYPLEELISDIDGTVAYRPSAEFSNAAIAGSWENANMPVDESIMWTCEADDLDDDDHVAVSPALLADLWRRARAYDRIMAVCVHQPRCECE